MIMRQWCCWLACAVMMGMGLGCAEHPSAPSGTSGSAKGVNRFSHAEIKLVGGSTKRVDATTAERLASFFPGLGTGQRSNMAGSWLPTMTIIFYEPDGNGLIVQSDGGSWIIKNPPRVEPEITTFMGPPGNPRGDFPVEGNLQGFIESLFKASRP
jgi:hypothetical protein